MRSSQTLFHMQDDIDVTILTMNFLEFLTNYLEGKVPLEKVFELNDRIQLQNPNSPSLQSATTALRSLQQRLDQEETVDEEEITDSITEVVMSLIDGQTEG